MRSSVSTFISDIWDSFAAGSSPGTAPQDVNDSSLMTPAIRSPSNSNPSPLREPLAPKSAGDSRTRPPRRGLACLLLNELPRSLVSARPMLPLALPSGPPPTEELAPALSQGKSALRWEPDTKSWPTPGSSNWLPMREGAREALRATPGSYATISSLSILSDAQLTSEERIRES